ncbi:MAG: chorismate-binding protein [Alicyclobacillus sp.]|nr:chorismate-binding protein [Alicyclobacillus sp.]
MMDPFDLYLEMVLQLGEGRAFLLDAGAETESQYQMSLVGGVPVLEVQVKDGVTRLFATPGLAEYLVGGLSALGIQAVDPAEETSVAPCVLGPPVAVYTHAPMALLEHLRRLMQSLYQANGPAREPFSAGFLGYIGYDGVHYLEQLPKTTRDDRGLPDIRLQVHAVVVHLVGGEARVHDGLASLQAVVDPATYTTLAADVAAVRALVERDGPSAAARLLQTLAEAGAGAEPESPVGALDDISQAQFEDSVRRARAYIAAGDIFQVVLSKRMRVQKRRHPYLVYDALRRVNPSPYMFIGEYPDMRIFGASPEVQFRAVHGVAEMKPIAGTSKGRGQTPAEDLAKREALARDEKERAEHVMLVDLCRNDLGRVCKTGTVRVRDLMHVEAYSHLFHLVSDVTGELREDVSVFEALLATFPAGTLSGAPKIRAMEIIDELETLRRGPYGGLIGMVDFDANANTAIVIRTVIEWRDTYYVQVGAGIVADSDPTQEWQECGHKAGAVLQVLGVQPARMVPETASPQR